MNKRTKRNRIEISARLVEAYRTNPPFSIADTVPALETFRSHRALFEALGDAQMAAAAERAWWQDAVLLAGEPASCVETAKLKIGALQPALDGRVWRTAREEHRGFSAMITAAVEAERSRWRLAAATRH